jgi:NAD(P)-dependent dehydrogenase (short-subunit alcohol dehydrogenase family)
MATVAITGAGRGIGLELTRQHLQAGDDVIALVRDPARAETLKALDGQSGGTLTVRQMDVGDDTSVKAAASADQGRVDILYNVAGIPGPTDSQVERTDWAGFDEAFNVMVKGPLRVTQAFLPRLHDGSKVINFSSQLGASTWAYPGYEIYAAAKAALNRLMRSYALGVKDRGIIIGLVHPGWVQTDMGGPGGEITPEESARGVRQVTADWTLDKSGDFYKWNGEPHAW